MPGPAIVVHGGAGNVFSDDREDASKEGCLRAAQRGFALLRDGAKAIDAVEAAAVVLEDDENFNAGTGSTLNVDGEIEADALIMDGQRRTGGIAALRGGFKNPIQLARRVMEDSPHVLLGGEGAARFAREQGIAPVPLPEMVTERALTRWYRERNLGWTRKPGTIGAVAIDSSGQVAAATSTGGISGKLVGRIGDTPLVGCGTYADDRSGAASATGHGESIIKVVMAKVACEALAKGASADEAAAAAVAELDLVDGDGGIIVVSTQGDVGLAFNTARMSRAWITADGQENCAFKP